MSIERFLVLGVFVIIPLLVTPFTSELFEFPKNAWLQISAILIGAFLLWRKRDKKEFWRKSSLWRAVILLFFMSLITSLAVSIDIRTSWFGYYGRFFGGAGSYLALFVVILALEQQLKETDIWLNTVIKGIMLSGAMVSLWAVLEHFGVDQNFWVQDVHSRVFSTLGQPNWLAAFLVTITPLCISCVITKKEKALYTSLSLLFYSALWFTSSLSGLVGLAGAMVVWLAIISRQTLIKNFSWLVILGAGAIIVSCLNPGLMGQRLQRQFRGSITIHAQETDTLPGGDSWEIRKYLWKGTWRLITSQPKIFFLGTGPATFAYSFLPFRPIELNKTSEWDFVYNKAHNEYLNIWAEQGLLGVICLVMAVIVAIWLTLKIPKPKRTMAAGLLAGWLGLQITNTTGFLVVSTAVLFWSYPLLIQTYGKKE